MHNAFNFPQCQWPRETESKVNELVVSVSILGETDAQIQLERVGKGPETDTRSMEMGGNLRPRSDSQL
jgi:hypothetical protein